MRTFSMSATNFYFMNRGEKLTVQQMYSAGTIYVIWPRGEKWDLRYKRHKGWEEIHNGLFDTENEAFLFAHQHFIDDDKPRHSLRRSVPV